ALGLKNPDGTAIDTLLGRRLIVFMSDLQCCEISQLPLGIAGHLLEALVRCEVPPVLKIEHCNANRSRLEHGSPTLLASPQSRLGPFTVSDVAPNTPVADEAPRPLQYRPPRHPP